MIWLRRAGFGLLTLLALAVLVIYAGSEVMLRRSYAAPLRSVAIPHDAAAVAEGARLARIVGCRDCHRANGEGGVLVDDWALGRLAPPPLARAIAGVPDAVVARAIRNGVAHDGTAMIVMPTRALANLSDQDVGRIIAWARTLRPAATDLTAPTRFGPLGRALILTGALPLGVVGDHATPATRPADVGPYLVSVSCAACHDLHAPRRTDDGKQTAPALAQIGAAYDPAAFRHLLRTGVGMSPRDLGLMRLAAKGGLRYLTDDEIAAIQAYLQREEAAHPTA